MATKEDVLHTALQLSPQERAELAEELLLSLDQEASASSEEWHRRWSAELDRRAREVLDGTVETARWDDVRASLIEELRQYRHR